MRIFAERGGARDVATIAAGGYAGRYAGHVRIAVTAITGYAELARIDYLDGSGRVLYSEPPNPVSGLGEPTVSPARRLLGRPGRPSLWQTSIRANGETSRCLTLTDGGPPAKDAPCEDRGRGLTALLAASCATRRLTVAVGAPAGARVIARLAGGRARALKLRDGAGLLTLSRSSGLRSLSIGRRGARTRTLRMDAPAGVKQCGWRAALTR